MKSLLFLLIASAFHTQVNAVKAEDFKRCDQSGFCARNRAYADVATAETGLSVVAESLKWDQLKAGKVTGKLERKGDGAVELLFELNVYGDGLDGSMVRMRVDESNATARPRYKVQNVLINDGKQLKPRDLTKAARGGSYMLSFKGGYLKLGLYPFTLDMYVGSELVAMLNHRNWFQFEHQREKPAPESEKVTPVDVLTDDSIATSDEVTDHDLEAVTVDEGPKDDMNSKLTQGMWEETFGSNTDSKPYGPASIAMDVTFAHSNNVYGIPQHAANLSLKSTRAGGEASFSDPFRLYNLDVFEYEIDKSEALYGAVPFLISHAKNSVTKVPQTVGFFWMNAAETWIDIIKESHADESLFFQTPDKKPLGSRSTTAHWISESGSMDFFVLLGPTAKQVQRQYAMLTGTQALPSLWSLGYHQCRWNYVDIPDVRQVHQGFEDYDIPVDVFWLDIEHTDDKKYFTWHDSKFIEPLKMIGEVAEKGRKVIIALGNY